MVKKGYHSNDSSGFSLFLQVSALGLQKGANFE